jgi:hypothetical protein
MGSSLNKGKNLRGLVFVVLEGVLTPFAVRRCARRWAERPPGQGVVMEWGLTAWGRRSAGVGVEGCKHLVVAGGTAARAALT